MPYPRCDMLLITLWALTDFTRENGATRVVPGSHRWDDAKKQLKHQGLYDLLPADFRHPTDDEIAYAEMPAGSCLMLLGSTLHSGGANVSTGQIRRGMYLGYILGWLRTEGKPLPYHPGRAGENIARRGLETDGLPNARRSHRLGGIRRRPHRRDQKRPHGGGVMGKRHLNPQHTYRRGAARDDRGPCRDRHRRGRRRPGDASNGSLHGDQAEINTPRTNLRSTPGSERGPRI